MTNGSYLSKEAILAADDLGFRDVSVPEWGGVVRVREMTASDREHFTDAYETRLKAREAGEHPLSIQALIVAMCVVDGAGVRLFSDAEVAGLERKSSRALLRVYEVAMELSALNRETVEELKKNSEASTSADSPTA
jgi:hypothetical protein